MYYLIFLKNYVSMWWKFSHLLMKVLFNVKSFYG